MTAAIPHEPVMLLEAICALNLGPGACVVDGTFGQGGHSRLILERIGPHGQLLALDRDPDACRQAQQQFGHDARFHIQHLTFGQMAARLSELRTPPAGILLDLGTSSTQLMDAQRGFSFRLEGPLDMRMNPAAGQSAAEWLNTATEDEIAFILRTYGEERRARSIARAIAQERSQQPITTTRQLAQLVAGIVRPDIGKHPATRVFLALRIQVNDELGELTRGLEAALPALAAAGRLVVISFHSLEDRIVKRFFYAAANAADVPRKLPLRKAELDSRRQGRIIGTARRPSAKEVSRNNRARSAVMRVFEKAA